ncbi:protein AF-10 isoform X5 [Toxorhynchites rutilus septentrionalis]|uniref:protein AF-10 isoform X5 n=1 Tax=Toxorhynchites rutilus septentrionalis TaxID=329112 RepID=UPI0024795206|nr:protein AF-10 isoform X5 [Toxorhynchites rutilus septentrionalis]
MKEMVGGCCVCSDDRGWSENPLVYCDGQSCAVAVHQACYGIVTVPSGPWYCRKCESQERSARVRCELCPSRDGALKRTDNLGWAHVVCALYIPEVRFGNVTTMEPIILQLIPQERYNKTCYICQEMGKGSRSTAGACMQCNKSGCKQQFHVTCAQQLGLLCEEAGNYLDNVKYCGYCQHHYSKLKKGGNVKTIPPYKPINHETNSSDGPSSPEKELDPPSSQPHSSGSGMGIGGSSNSVKSNNRLPSDQIGSSSTSSSSKQRKSSSVSKNSTSAALTSSSTTLAGSGSNSASINSQATSSVFTGVPTINPASTSSGTTGGNISKTGSSSSSSSSKDKDKYNKNVNKISSTNKTHDKDPSSSSTASSSSSSQRDKSSKSSKSGSSSSSSSNSNSSGASGVTSGIGSGTGGNSTNASSTANSSLPKESDLSSLPPSASTALSMITSTMKHTENGANKQDKTLAQISSAAASSARAASLSPAAIPTTLIIKPPHEPSGSNKELLSKEAIAKFTTSNFTETIVVNSDSVFGTSNTGGGSGSANAAPTGSSISTGNTMISTAGSTSVVDTGSTSGAGSKMSISGGSSFAGTGSSVAKKRKAEARSTPTLISTGDIDINRDLIKDVAVSLVPLPLNKSDNIDPASISGIEKSIKKAKTEPNSPHHPGGGGDTNLQNVSPNLIQTHASNVITSSIKHQQQSNSPQFQSSQQLQAQQLQAQQHTPSLVVSVPLSTATVPGVNLPTNNSSSSSATVNNASNTGGSSNSTPNIVSPGQVPSGSSLYQQLTQRTGEQLMSASTNRSSPVIQLQSSATNHVIQSSTHSILERQSPSMRSSPAIITSAGTQQQQQSLQHSHHQYMPAGVELNTNSMSASLAALQSASPVPMSTIQSTSSSPITPGGDGGLKITYEKQTSNTRIAALLEQEATGRRSRSQSRERSGGNGSGNGGKTRTSKKRSLQQQQQQRSSPLTNSGTPDNSFGSNSSFSGGGGGGGGGGLKFSYEAQPTTNPAMIGATSTIITHQPMVKESPPSSPGSDSGMVRSNKRNRKLSTNSNTQSGAPDAKESKLFQNGVVHATHMLGNQLNPSSSVAQKMSDQLTMEMETHAFVVETGPQLVGPPFPGKVQASRANNASAPATGGPSLSSMLSGNGTATANGNTPQSLEQLLERQWEQGSQFLMEQAQHFDIASLLSCLHQLRSENIRLEEHVNNLVARRDHLLAVNARLAIPLNPAALGGVGLGGGGGGGVTGGASAGSTGSSGAGSAGSQAAQFNNMHGNGSHDGSNTTSATTISSRSSRIQQHQTQQQPQHSQSHFVSNSSNQIPIENGIDFRHSNSIHQNTNSSSIRHHSPPGQSYLPSSGQPTRQNAASLNSGSAADQQSSHARSNRAMNSSSGNSAINSNNAASSGNASSSAVYQSQQQTIYNTAHQIPLLLEHHQQEHHSQQQLQQQTQQQTPQPPQPHHLRQTSPTVSSRSHKTHSARAVGAAPSVSHSHHPSHHPHHHQSHTSAHPPSHGPSPQQQSLPQRQRH